MNSFGGRTGKMLLSKVTGHKQVSIWVGGHLIAIDANKGLCVFLYNRVRRGETAEGAVAMAYDSQLPFTDHVDVLLDGTETD